MVKLLYYVVVVYLAAVLAEKGEAMNGNSPQTCDCENFCSSHCAYSTGYDEASISTEDASANVPVLNITLYRFTPPNSDILTIEDRNTGDVAGDLLFFLDRRALTARCKLEPGNERCFLAPIEWVAFGRWNVMVDSRWGPYQSCIPRYTSANFSSWDVHNFACTENCNTPTVSGIPSGCPQHAENGTRGADGQLICECAYARHAVGRLEFGGTLKGRNSHVFPDRGLPDTFTDSTPRSCAYTGMEPFANGSCIVSTRDLGARHAERRVPAPCNSTATATALAACCSLCEQNATCRGYNVMCPVGKEESTCELFSEDFKIVDGTRRCSNVVYSGVKDTTGYLPGGVEGWNWMVQRHVAGAWFSTLREGQCRGSSVPGVDRGCTWKVLGTPLLVNATCVLSHINHALEQTDAMQSCLRRFKCFPLVSAEDREQDCYLRCTWEAVGGNGYPPTVPWDIIQAAFLSSFNDPDHGGCARINASTGQAHTHRSSHAPDASK
eukprot:m.163339 g.163339  ORF g.163339 m.163339 type:complete len:495 (-) comp18100_c0_seq12:337-1821(-)